MSRAIRAIYCLVGWPASLLGRASSTINNDSTNFILRLAALLGYQDVSVGGCVATCPTVLSKLRFLVGPNDVSAEQRLTSVSHRTFFCSHEAQSDHPPSNGPHASTNAPLTYPRLDVSKFVLVQAALFRPLQLNRALKSSTSNNIPQCLRQRSRSPPLRPCLATRTIRYQSSWSQKPKSADDLSGVDSLRSLHDVHRHHHEATTVPAAHATVNTTASTIVRLPLPPAYLHRPSPKRRRGEEAMRSPIIPSEDDRG